MNEDMYKTSYTPIIEQSSSHSCSSLNLMISPIQQHCPLPRYGYQRDMATIWLPARYGCQRDMLAWKILAVTGRHFKWSPLSSDIAYERDVAVNEILLPARYSYQPNIASNGIWLPARYGYLRDMRACKILGITECLILVLNYTARYDSLWLPERYSYLRDIATWEIWLPERYGYLKDMATCEICVPARY